jgi:hypothetical protein
MAAPGFRTRWTREIGLITENDLASILKERQVIYKMGWKFLSL